MKSARAPQAPRPVGSRGLPTRWLAPLLLLLLGLAAFQAAPDNAFVNYDDDIYVTKNPNVGAGLTMHGLGWAFTSFSGGNWHPLTWVSHMLDVELYGLSPAGHHRTSVVLHLLNALLLLLALRLLTGALWRSFLVAALFAVHPLHVESVAWVAERKDVLSAFFWILAMAAYAHYARRPSPFRYVLVALALAAGLLAKPMVVTLPFTLLILDFWPLARIEGGPGFGRSLARRLREKIPLFALVAVVSVITYVAQTRAGAVSTAEGTTLLERALNALAAYGTYLGRTLWPHRLAVFYPFPQAGVRWLPTLLGGLVLIAGTAAVLRFGARRWLPAGWAWYLGTLVPVIGLVRVGSQSMADRYTYLPLIGIFWMIAWGAEVLAQRGESVRRSVVAGAAVALILLTVATRMQVQTWRSSETLFRHALAVAEDNTLVRLNLGEALAGSGRVPEAIEHFRRAIELYPQNDAARNDLGLALATVGRPDEAIPHLEEAIRLRPGFAEAHFNLGNVLMQKRRIPEAVAAYRRALEFAPNEARMHCNLGTALLFDEDLDGAEAAFRRALQFDAGHFRASYGLGNLAARRGQPEDALAHYREALRLQPGYVEALNSMGIVLASQGRLEEARAAFERALAARPDDAEARRNLAKIERATTLPPRP